MFQDIPSEYKSSAIRLLQFLVHTKRPLTLLEAAKVIATEINQEPRGFDVKRRLFQTAGILRYCPSLVIIAEVTNYAETVEELHLAHFSVKEYLLKQAQFDLESASIVGLSSKIASEPTISSVTLNLVLRKISSIVIITVYLAFREPVMVTTINPRSRAQFTVYPGSLRNQSLLLMISSRI
jgi:hypothetical protein